MREKPDSDLLGLIEAALADRNILARLPACLAAPYMASLDLLYRPSNRLAVALFTVIFDLFHLSEMVATPELVPLSAALRFGLYTPAALIFVLIDRSAAPLPRRVYDVTLLALAGSPSIICAILCVHTTSTHSLSDVHATTLILLAVGLTFRMRVFAVYVTAAIAFAAFLSGLLLTPIIPRSELPSLLLTDLAIAVTVISFTTLLNRRDKLVFLLNMREQVRSQDLSLQNQGLRAQVDIDQLTGLANRRCFDRTLGEQWLTSWTEAVPVGLIMIDIDHFKKFNDCYGHQGGDDCLRRIAQRAHSEMRDTDLLARYGGEEFAAILPGATLSMTHAIAERMLAAVADLAIPHEGAGPGCRVSISLGAASVTPDASSGPASLVEMADRCLYAAKRAGRNRVSLTDFDLGVVEHVAGS